MRIQTLEYNANQPIAQQIVVPTNSDYAVGVKVTKDGQVVDGDLTIGGIEPTTTIGDYNIVKLESDGVEGMTEVEVEVGTEPTIEKEIVGTAERINTSTRARTVSLVINLSDYFSEPITITPHDINLVKFQYCEGGTGEGDEYGEWIDTFNYYGKPGEYITFTDIEGVQLMYCYQETTEYPFSWITKTTAGSTIIETGTKMIPNTAKISFNVVWTAQPNTKVQVRAIIDIDTHDGFHAQFPLYIQQKDMGYFEKDED